MAPPSSGRRGRRDDAAGVGCLVALAVLVIAVLAATMFVHDRLAYGQSPSDVLHPCPADSYGDSTRVHGTCPDQAPAAPRVPPPHR